MGVGKFLVASTVLGRLKCELLDALPRVTELPQGGVHARVVTLGLEQGLCLGIERAQQFMEPRCAECCAEEDFSHPAAAREELLPASDKPVAR